MLSQTAEYALRAVLHLARKGGGNPLRVEDVAEALDAPRNYLSKILHSLTRSGVLTSTRGPHGGFELARPGDEITLADVVEGFDPMEDRAACLLGKGRCDERNPCPAHGRWTEVYGGVRAFFHETTLAELAGLTKGDSAGAAVSRDRST